MIGLQLDYFIDEPLKSGDGKRELTTRIQESEVIMQDFLKIID
jgi:hypothetical protein